jgi:hypothetical protein
MKYLFITLKVQDGENSHTHRILHTTPGDNIELAAQRYAATYYPDEPERTNSWWFFFSGTIAVEVERVTELTEYEYKLMSRIFSGDKDRNDYFQIVSKGYEAGLQREEVEINLGENGKLMLYKTPEGSVVDVYNQDEEVNTMTIWEDDLTPLPEEDEEPGEMGRKHLEPTADEIQSFKAYWGQTHDELCNALGLDNPTSDDIIMLDYFWIAEDKMWYNKEASTFTERDQEIADYLRHKQ